MEESLAVGRVREASSADIPTTHGATFRGLNIATKFCVLVVDKKRMEGSLAVDRVGEASSAVIHNIH
jgi:hypothetical protein